MGAQKFRLGYMEIRQRQAAAQPAAPAPIEDDKIERWMGKFMKIFQWILWTYTAAFAAWMIWQMIQIGWL